MIKMSLEESKKEQLRELLRNLALSIDDLCQFYNKNKDLEIVKKLFPELSELVKSSNSLFDKMESVLEELCPSFNC